MKGAAAMRVVVLGSAPDARWPQSDVLVAAKRSLLYYPEAMSDTSRVETLGYPEDQRSVLEGDGVRRNMTPGRLGSVTVGIRVPEESGPIIEEFRALLGACGSPMTEVLTMDRTDRREAWERASGLREPILEGIGSYGAGGVLYAMRRATHGTYKRLRAQLLGGAPRLIRRHGIFRPSTGVVALCRAMQRFGPSAEYVLAGVSLTWPRRYPDPGRDAFRGGEDFAPVPVHINADRQVLRRLAMQWNLATTSSELADALRVPCYPV